MGMGTQKRSANCKHEMRQLVTRCTTFARLLFYGGPSIKETLVLLTGLISAIASGIPFPIMAIVFGQLVDDMNSSTCNATPANAHSYQAGINTKVLQIVYIGIAYFVLIYIYVFCWNISGEWLAQRLREKYFQSLLRQDASFFDTLAPGEASSRITGDISTIQQGTSEKVGIVLNSIAFFVTSYVVAFIKDARLAGMLVSLAPAYLIMSLVGGYFVRKYFGRALECMAAASAVALEAFSNTMLVHAFSASARLEERFVEHLGPARVAGIRKSIATATQAGLLYFIAFSANALAFWQGSIKIAGAVEGGAEGDTVGSTYTVILVLVDASLILSQVAPFLQSFDAAAVAFKKLERDIERPSPIDGTADAGLVPAGKIGSDIEFRNVSFRFPSRPDKPILQDLSLRIPEGKQTAFVGLSGSGKSTVAGLMARFYDAEEGQVMIGGHDVRELNVRFLRSTLSLVQQEPCLLDRSILENVALGLVNSTAHVHLTNILKSSALEDIATAVREKGLSLNHAIDLQPSNKEQIREIVSLVETAAGLADASNFINKLDHGYATMVGSGGNLISGGQKQRISIARALVKSPQILILDEATASLDSATEIRVQRALEKAGAGRTLVTIAHRLSTIKNADNIIVLRQGKLIEQGSHAELLAADGAYAELVRLQNLNVNALQEGVSSSARPSSDSTAREKEKIAKVTSVQDDESSSRSPKEKKKHTDEEPVATERSVSSTSKAIASLFRPYSLALFIAATGAVVIGGTYCASAVIFGNVVGKLSSCETAESIRHAGEFWGLMFFVLALIEFFANLISWSLFGWIAEQLIYKVRVLSLRSILEQKLEWHEARTPSGLLSLIVKDSNALNGLTGSVICTILSILVNLFAAIILTHIIAWRIALVCLSVVPLLLGAGFMRVSTLARFEERHNDAFARSLGITVEAVTFIKSVHALAIESEVLSTYRRSLQRPIREITGQSAFTNLWLAVGYGLSNFVYALAYWWGAKQIISGHYTQTQFFIVQLALLVSSQLWGQMFALAPDVSRAVQATHRLLNLLDLGSAKKLSDPITSPLSATTDLEATSHSAEKPPPLGLPGTQSGLSVSFKQVHFTYPARPDTQVLHGLDLTISAGQFAALVGPSGAGKSTIISLIERLYTPSSGTIELNNRNIAHMDASFRDEVAYVPQHSVLFDGSIRFNLELGARPNQSLTQTEIEEACKLANIHETIVSLPDGYETAVGPNGDRLSGGQKQRLAIARALLRRPRLLLLDESTSALDAESERLLQDGLEKAARGITVIAIAHRLYTIRKADVIFLIEEGRCVERGSHAELMERSESYRVNALNQAVDS
ncbi:P-loop containing nucleoside triphosphate hydrolase protein [Aspergillus desertorum]